MSDETPRLNGLNASRISENPASTITRIEVEGEEVTFFFSDSDMPWGPMEFRPESQTRKTMAKIELEIRDYNERWNDDSRG